MTNYTNEWAHFVGGLYTPSSFMREAKKFDVSRNITPQQAKGLKFGDVVNLMQWTDGEAKLFRHLSLAVFLYATLMCRRRLPKDCSTKVAPDQEAAAKQESCATADHMSVAAV